VRVDGEIKDLVPKMQVDRYKIHDIEVVVEQGVPATEIVKVAETSNVDVLLIGPPRQWTSTTQAVLAKSLCPVLITHDVRPLPYPTDKLANAASAPR